MRLLVNGGSIPVAQMGPDFLIIKEACDHPPGQAIMVLQVDKNERRWTVRLPNGISSGSKRVTIGPGAQDKAEG
jgi:hypothetical protein